MWHHIIYPHNIMSKYTLLKAANNQFVGLRSHDTSYLIGFQKKKYASDLAKVLCHDPKIIICPSQHQHNQKVDCNLMQMGVPDKAISYLNVHTHTQLIFQKDTNSTVFDYEITDMTGFVNLPFVKYLGIIMPYQKIEENDQHVVFMSCMIEPYQDIVSFRSALAMTMH